jgi:hypothetical protein
MNDKRKIERTICSRQVSFSIDGLDFEGTIENISKEGTLILTPNPPPLDQESEIVITISSADQIDMKRAQIVWADKHAFGAKFL